VVDLAKRYRSGSQELVIFAGLNITIEPGERLALIGESGAGKSTILHLLGGLDRPSEGRLFFGDIELTSLNESALADFRNRQIGFVWQTHHLLPEFTALENVMMPLLIRGESRKEATDVASRLLEEVGLGARSHHRSGELSGGEQQRVVLARSLVGGPSVLLLDEPTGNLDYNTGNRIADLLDGLHATHRLTSVVVTHNIDLARRCDRILRLENGFLVPYEESAGSFANLQRGDLAQSTASQEDGINHV
jgi:lipoprotein-releasing system ATP-binding protein